MKPQTVIITRAEPGASETADRLRALGYVPVKLPALEISLTGRTDLIPPRSGETCIFTSANGVRAVKDAGWPTGFPAICVGPATFEAAGMAGFAPLLNADGNSNSVFDLICERFAQGAAPGFVHVANADAAGDLVRRLNRQGHKARFLPLYEARPVAWEACKADAVSAFSSGAYVLLHSARAAEVLSDWLVAGELAPEGLAIIAISPRCLLPLRAFEFASVSIAERPNETELMKALQTRAEPGVSSD